MSDKLYKAIYNNNGLYQAILNSRQIKSVQTPSIWYSLEKTPPLYSNIVTLSEDWVPDDIFRSIDLTYERERWEEWSLKDSFKVLDLSNCKFEKLFDAQWMYLETEKFRAQKKNKNLRYEIVGSEDALSMWRIAWDSDIRLGKEIFNTKLLDDENVHFVAGYQGEQIVSGGFVNKTDNVLGISNFFAPDKSIDYWSSLIEFILNSIEPLDIVGYQRKKTVDQLQSCGFESVGNLSVWLKKRNSSASIENHDFAV